MHCVYPRTTAVADRYTAGKHPSALVIRVAAGLSGAGTSDWKCVRSRNLQRRPRTMSRHSRAQSRLGSARVTQELPDRQSRAHSSVSCRSPVAAFQTARPPCPGHTSRAFDGSIIADLGLFWSVCDSSWCMLGCFIPSFWAPTDCQGIPLEHLLQK